MATETAVTVVERYAFASAMGGFPIRRLVDAETGEAQTLAFVHGVALPYRWFVAHLLSTMTDRDWTHGSHVANREIKAIWARVKLIANARQRLELGISVDQIVHEFVESAYKQQVRDMALAPAGQIERLIREIEDAQEEAEAEPVIVTGLSDLLAPLIYAAPWAEAASKYQATKQQSAAILWAEINGY